MPYYTVRTEQFGDITKTADTIKDARKWAKSAFPREPVRVSRQYARQFCDLCGCAPCCCMVREDA